MLARPVEVDAYISVVAAQSESPLHAAINDWEYPLSREGLLIMQLIDVVGESNSKKGRWRRIARPYRDKGERFGWTDLPPDEAKSLLDANAGR